MIISPLTGNPSLLPTIGRWQHAEFGYLTASTTIDDRIARLGLSLQSTALPLTFVALLETGETVGRASVYDSTIIRQDLTPWLLAVYVPPEHRSKGIASSLILHAVSEVAQLGYESLYLFTPKSKDLYARLGWVEFGAHLHRQASLTLMRKMIL